MSSTVHAGQAARTEHVHVSALADLPVHARNISEKLVRVVAGEAQKNPVQASPIPVGRVGSSLYVVNDFETVMGLRSAKVRAAEVLVSEYASVADVVIEHVRRNFRPHAIDPLRLYEVVQYLKKCGMGGAEASKALWLDQRPELAGVLRCSITDGARAVLSDMVDKISSKVYNAVLPPYYITKISRVADQKQEAIARALHSLMMAKTVSDASFAWHTADTVSTTINNFEKKRPESTVKDRVGRLDGGPEPDEKIVKKAENFIRNDPDLIYIPTKGNGPDLIVNKKTARVTEARDINGTYSLVGDGGSMTSTVPRAVTMFLDAENEEVPYYKYASLDRAEGALRSARARDERCVVMTFAKLRRR